MVDEWIDVTSAIFIYFLHFIQKHIKIQKKYFCSPISLVFILCTFARNYDNTVRLISLFNTPAFTFNIHCQWSQGINVSVAFPSFKFFQRLIFIFTATQRNFNWELQYSGPALQLICYNHVSFMRKPCSKNVIIMQLINFPGLSQCVLGVTEMVDRYV